MTLPTGQAYARCSKVSMIQTDSRITITNQSALLIPRANTLMYSAVEINFKRPIQYWLHLICISTGRFRIQRLPSRSKTHPSNHRLWRWPMSSWDWMATGPRCQGSPCLRKKHFINLLLKIRKHRNKKWRSKTLICLFHREWYCHLRKRKLLTDSLTGSCSKWPSQLLTTSKGLKRWWRRQMRRSGWWGCRMCFNNLWGLWKRKDKGLWWLKMRNK